MDPQTLSALAASLAMPVAPSVDGTAGTVAAVNSAGAVLPPCGRCRELLW
jgi:cytidine deaminase